jgi:hypothetical protein
VGATDSLHREHSVLSVRCCLVAQPLIEPSGIEGTAGRGDADLWAL